MATTLIAHDGIGDSQAAGGRWLGVVTHLDPCYGGLSAVVPQLGSTIAAAGRFAMSLAAFCDPGERYSPTEYPGLSLTEWPASRAAWFKDRSLRSRFDRLLAEVDGLHIHGLWEQSTMVAARAARARKLPYVVSAHGMLEPWALANKRLKKIAYSTLIERGNLAGASCLHALTRAEAEDYRRYGVDRPIAVIPNGVRIPDHLSPDLFLARYPELDGKRIVLFLGRIHFKKGLNLLVEAWERIAAQRDDAHLVLAGPDSEGTQAQVTAAIQQAGVSDRVLFTGMLRDELKWSALAAAECFVLPSYSEGLSVSALEAMGAGLPIIVSDRCNLPEVAQWEAGWVVPPEANRLERALEEALGNSRRTNAAIGKRGRDLVRARYHWTRVAEQMGAVYAWAQGGKEPASVEILNPGGRR